MAEQNLERQLIIYEAPFTQITSVEQARAETAFLHKAYDLGMYNKMLYTNSLSGGFHSDVNAENINQHLQQIVGDAENGNLPSKYSIGMNVGFDGERVNTRVFEKEE